MQRRRLLQLGLGAGAVFALAGTAALAWRPGLDAGRLSAGARAIFQKVAEVVLDGSLPTEPAARQRALAAHVERVQATIHGLPLATRHELSMLLGLLDTAPGRLGMLGVATPWEALPAAALADALNQMRTSRVQLRQQAYSALRELTNASYFAERGTWQLLGYPGPLDI